jgi:hypothetical protein
MRVTVVVVFAALAGTILWFRFSLGADLRHDFTAFYLAGKIPPKSLYDQDAFRSAGERWLAPQGVSYYPPYIRPAVFAVPLRLLSSFSYRRAFAVWLVLLYASYIAAIAMAFLIFRPPFYVLALFGAFYPALIGPTVGQDASIEAAIIGASLALLLVKRDVAAGAVLACALYKFNLILLLPLVFVAHSRYRALVSFCICGSLLAGVSALLSPTSTYVRLLKHLPEYDHVPAGLTSAVRIILSAAGLGGLYIPLAVLAAIATFVAIKHLPIQEGYCLAIIACYLFAYKVAWYDATILVIPLVAAFRRDSGAMAIPALFLLLPVLWILFESGTVIMLLVLYAGFALPAIMPMFEIWRAKGSPVRA